MENKDWGNVTPEGFNERNNEALHVFNFDISKRENIENAILFTLGKIVRSAEHLPKNCKQIITFDVRGQELEGDTVNYIVGEIGKKISMLSKEFLNYSIHFKFS
jgi:hypothetical protein